LFFTTAGTLRAPWRLLLFMGAFVASLFIMMAIAAPILGGAFSAAGIRGQTVASLVQMLAALLATWFCLRWVEKKPWSEVGLHVPAARPKELGIGTLVGAGAIAIPIVLLIATGWLARADGTTSAWGGPMLRMTMLLLPAALAEELVIRGYVLTAFRDGIGWRGAVLITSVAFGLLHMQNPGSSVQSVGVVALAGVFLAVIRIATDSLYAAWAAHFAWNWVMAAVFHLPVSGFAFEYPAYRYVDAGPDWATGGSWGPESGVPAAMMMMVGVFLMLKQRARSRRADEPIPASSSELQAQTSSSARRLKALTRGLFECQRGSPCSVPARWATASRTCSRRVATTSS
jgi:membrane protease YdiL (CAAX protease family)